MLAIVSSISSPGQTAEQYYERGAKKAKANELHGSMAELNKAIAINQVGKYYLLRGKIKVKLSDFRGAKDDFTEAINHNYKSRDVYICRIILCDYLRDTDQAMEDCRLLISLNPKDGEAFYYLGLAEIYEVRRNLTPEAFKNYDQGCRTLSKAGELGYKDAYKKITAYCNN